MDAFSRELMKRLITLLGVRERVACAEASPTFDRVVEEQIECSTTWQWRRGKRILVLALKETEETESMHEFRAHYIEVHVILAKKIVEAPGHKNLKKALEWLKEVTYDGRVPVTTVEIMGSMGACGCRFGEIARFTRHMIIGAWVGRMNRVKDT